MVLRRMPLILLALLGVDFLDELCSGVPTVGAPGIQESFALTYTMAALVIFTLPRVVSTLLEPPLFILADRYSKRWFVCGGLGAMGICALAAGLAPGFWVLALALGLSGTASGCGVTLAQAALMDANPDRRERLMTWWTFSGALGDLAAPALFWLLAVLALGWREAFLLSGAVLLLYAGLLARGAFPAALPTAEPSLPSVREAVVAALRSRRLLLWVSGVWLCGLLDEILVAFGALHMRDNLGADPGTRSAILMCWMLGGMAGLVLLDRLVVRTPPLRLLRIAAVGCSLAYLAWILAPTVVASGALMLLVGCFSAQLYPLAMAQAYRALPGQSGMVNALGNIFAPIDLALPFFLGVVADHLGLVPALLLLTAQPVGLLWIATWQRRADRWTPSGPSGYAARPRRGPGTR